MKLVIESVLRNIAHKEVDRLPQKTAVCDMLLECLTCAQARIGEELSQDDGVYLASNPCRLKYGLVFIAGVLVHMRCTSTCMMIMMSLLGSPQAMASLCASNCSLKRTSSSSTRVEFCWYCHH